ncbi:chaperonin 10-like protein, partial [Pilaira anomala]
TKMESIMKGIQLISYGSPSQSICYRENLPIPEITRDTEILVHVKAAGVNPNETKEPSSNIKIFTNFFSPLPRIIGADFAGVIIDKGNKVDAFDIGDSVFGTQPFPFCVYGTYAEYTVVDITEAAIAKKPATISFEEAAAAGMAAITAYRGIIDNGLITSANMKIKRKCIIIGASGGVGSYAVQIAKAINSENTVVAICSGKNESFVKSLGADDIVDYTDETAYNSFIETSANQSFDIVFNCIVGNDWHYHKVSSLLKKKDSVYSFIAGPNEKIGSHYGSSFAEFSLFCTNTYRNVFSTHRYAIVSTFFCSYDIFSTHVVPLFATKAIRAPFKDDGSIIPLKDAKEAQEILFSKHAVGKIILKIN